jgi:hypothetical protein
VAPSENAQEKLAKATQVVAKQTQKLMAGDPAAGRQPMQGPQAQQTAFTMVMNSLKKKYQLDCLQVHKEATGGGGGGGGAFGGGGGFGGGGLAAAAAAPVPAFGHSTGFGSPGGFGGGGLAAAAAAPAPAFGQSIFGSPAGGGGFGLPAAPAAGGGFASFANSSGAGAGGFASFAAAGNANPPLFGGSPAAAPTFGGGAGFGAAAQSASGFGAFGQQSTGATFVGFGAAGPKFAAGASRVPSPSIDMEGGPPSTEAEATSGGYQQEDPCAGAEKQEPTVVLESVFERKDVSAWTAEIEADLTEEIVGVCSKYGTVKHCKIDTVSFCSIRSLPTEGRRHLLTGVVFPGALRSTGKFWPGLSEIR